MESILLKVEEVRELGKKVMEGLEAYNKLSNKCLTKNQIEELKRLYEEGIKARDIIFINNQRLVSFIVKSYHVKGLDYEDLFQAGSMGLLTAIEKYDYRKENLFSTYAGLWIKQSISRTIANDARAIRLPDNVYKKTNKYKKSVVDLATIINREPTVEEIAKSLNITVQEVLDYMNYSMPISSLDAKISADDDSSYCDLIPDNTTLSPEKKLLKKKRDETLYKTIGSVLNNNERYALCGYYGLDGKGKRNYDELGVELGLSGERVRQLVKAALGKLRTCSSADDLKALMIGTM